MRPSPVGRVQCSRRRLGWRCCQRCPRPRFLLMGVGFLGILVQREHRALHDLIAGTAVIYAWDARAARLRFLARQADIGATGSSRRPARSEGDDG